MNISLPYSKSRRYLTGIDWVVGAMNHDARQGHGAGAISQAVIDVEGRLDDGVLREAMGQVSRRFPLIHGRVARDWFNLAPYWKSPARAPGEGMGLAVVDLKEAQEEEAERLINEHVNTAMRDESEHLRFLLVRLGEKRSRLGMAFDHRLLDAFGAEAILRLIDLTWRGKLEVIAPQIRVTEAAQLDRWEQRFNAGKTLTKIFHKLREQDVCALVMPKKGQSRKVRFIHDQLSVEQSEAFVNKAGDEIGVPIVLPSAAARAVGAMRAVYPTSPLAGSHHLLFTTVTTRPSGLEWDSVFFNPFVFMVFSAANGEVGESTVAGVFRDQFFDLMRQGVPAAMQDASALARIFPLPVVSHFAKEIGKGRLCSLYFACIKETGFGEETFLGRRVENLVHTPLAFCPPGLNLCMTFFAGRFNLVLAYVEGTVEESKAAAMMQEFKRTLV